MCLIAVLNRIIFKNKPKGTGCIYEHLLLSSELRVSQEIQEY